MLHYIIIRLCFPEGYGKTVFIAFIIKFFLLILNTGENICDIFKRHLLSDYQEVGEQAQRAGGIHSIL